MPPTLIRGRLSQVCFNEAAGFDNSHSTAAVLTAPSSPWPDGTENLPSRRVCTQFPLSELVRTPSISGSSWRHTGIFSGHARMVSLMTE